MTHTRASSASSDHRDFVTTHWSVVLAAAQEDRPQSREAWEKLAQNYWPPLYAYIRRLGREPEDAKDLTQSFFVGGLPELQVQAQRDQGETTSVRQAGCSWA